jgi:hypothetical protein
LLRHAWPPGHGAGTARNWVTCPSGADRAASTSRLAVALKGIWLNLPACEALAGESQAHAVMTRAINARDEITADLRKILAAGNG